VTRAAESEPTPDARDHAGPPNKQGPVEAEALLLLPVAVAASSGSGLTEGSMPAGW
jgi:hypothetical protein